jgi:hypothetical protein
MRQQQLHLGPFVLRGGNGGTYRRLRVFDLEREVAVLQQVELLQRAFYRAK